MQIIVLSIISFLLLYLINHTPTLASSITHQFTSYSSPLQAMFSIVAGVGLEDLQLTERAHWVKLLGLPFHCATQSWEATC